MDDIGYVDWQLIDFDEPKDKAGEASASPASVCPKCGRALKKRGAHFHIRACEGSK